MIIHFSIDDVFGSLKYLSLNKNKCTSIFDSIFFSALKDIHEKFDVNFSLYCMYERGGYTLEDFTDCYKEEFMKIVIGFLMDIIVIQMIQITMMQHMNK